VLTGGSAEGLEVAVQVTEILPPELSCIELDQVSGLFQVPEADWAGEWEIDLFWRHDLEQ
jgi:hypothetical protein